MLRALSLTPSEAGLHGLDVNRDGRRRTAFDLLALPGIDIPRLAGIWPQIGAFALVRIVASAVTGPIVKSSFREVLGVPKSIPNWKRALWRIAVLPNQR